MKKENRYYVLKATDLEAAYQVGLIEPEAIDILEKVSLAVEKVREQRGKGELECLVIESDWPEHDIVWGMIEKRMSEAKIL